jgi:5-carboxymethyl-2-hydroxymuconate isomerase
MPHLTLEYTRNLNLPDPSAALAALNAAMAGSGLFDEADIKSRAIALDNFKIGTAPAPRAFAHVRIALLAGRSAEQRKTLADAALAALSAILQAPAGTELQLSVETVDLDRPSYAKAVIHGA